MSLFQSCTPRPSVFTTDRRATVLNLDTFLEGRVDGGEFFEETYFTNGMTTLVDRAFRHLSGQGVGSSIFKLSQAMGGGKTHSMIALGLLARDPALRRAVLGVDAPGAALGPCTVIGFNGRNVDAPGGIWGSLAGQLGTADGFREFVSPFLRAPGPQAWRELLGNAPLVVFLDELPPYLEGAAAVPVGNADLAVVTTTALANLFVAVAEMPNVCLVISDLGGTNYAGGQERVQAALEKAVQGIAAEAQRIAVPITPVNPNGDELYHILRKRIFKSIAPDAEKERVASAYRDALKEANSMGLTTTRPETLHARIVDAYPFHPDLRELFGKFRENEGFQQTRGVIRLMQMLVADLWNRKKAQEQDLIHPYDLDFNNDEIASAIREINPALSEAIAHDIAHGGTSEAEEIDVANGNKSATEAARLILIASLSTVPAAVHGIREHELIDCLQRPGRDLASFKAAVLDKLATRAWYLHASQDGRLYFKNQQNLAAKLRATALALNSETVDRLLRERLADYFAPSIRDCYQSVSVLEPQDAVRIDDMEKTTLVIVRPGNGANSLPVSVDWQAWWTQQQFKNRVLFLSGARDTYQKVVESARQVRALKSIEDELNAESTPANDPQWRALDALRDRINMQFSSALKEAFDVLAYPSLNAALRPAPVTLDFAGNQNGEATIRHSLIQAKKLSTETSGDAFRSLVEARLFGGAQAASVLWADLKRTAATHTQWPLHRPSALDDLKAECVRQGLWRDEGAYVRRGPFPPSAPDVAIRELSVDEDGVACLKIESLHGDMLVFETGDAEPTRASSKVETPMRFPARALKYRFRSYNSKDPKVQGEVRDWTAKLVLRHEWHNRGTHLELELKALPDVTGVCIRYTTDGSSPTGPTAAVYDGKFRVPAQCRVVCAVAQFIELGLSSEPVNVSIPQKGADVQQIDLRRPAKWTGRLRLDDSGASWNFISTLQACEGSRAHDVDITVENPGKDQVLNFLGTTEAGYDAAALTGIARRMQELVAESSLRIAVGSVRFPTGQALLDWLRATNQQFDPNSVNQAVR